MTLTDDKKSAYLTLWEVLTAVSRLMAPFSPFLAEEIYLNLTGEDSVHLADYPVSSPDLIDHKLDAEMQTVINLVSLGRAARNNCQIKVRQPLQTMYIPFECQALVQRNEWLVKEEINIKDIEYIKREDSFIDYDIKVNFKKMGPRFGKYVKDLAAALDQVDHNEIVVSLNSSKAYNLNLDGRNFELLPEDLIITIKNRENLIFAAENDLFVALNTKLTDELVMEGLARELINKIQYSRKKFGFEIMDRIRISYYGNDEMKTVFTKYEEYIKSETLTDDILCVEDSGELTSFVVNNHDVRMKITKNRERN